MVGFGFGAIEKVYAEGTCTYQEKLTSDTLFAKAGETIEGSGTYSSESECSAVCTKNPTQFSGCSYVETKKATKADDANTLGTCYRTQSSQSQDGSDLGTITVGGQMTKSECTSKGSDYSWKSSSQVETESEAKRTSNAKAITGDDVCPEVGLTTGVKSWLNCILVYILRFMGILLTVATTLFAKVIDVDVFKQVVSNNSVIYEMWGLVRDMLNIAFILVLLFSAFCTVFQISKYSYKNILLTLIIMALLVNFSFPIARVIIDFSNVLMYYLINGMGVVSNGAGFFAEFSKNSAIHDIIYIKNVKGADTSFLFAAIVFIFIFAVTLLMIGLLLLIRIIALAILIIFASLAFVGSIVPFLSSYSSKWWDALFKYSFFGPIMIFMLIIASKMMSKVTNLQSAFQTTANGQTQQNPSTIAAMAFFLIPIVILWVGISVAQSMSIAGAGAVVGRGQKFMGWAGRTFSGYRLGKAAGGASLHWADRKMAETKGLRYLSPMAVKDAWKKRSERADRKALAVSSGKVQNALNKAIGHVASANPFVAASRFLKGRKSGGITGGVKSIFKPLDIDTTDYDFIEQQRYVNEERERIKKTNDNSDYVLYEYDLAKKRGEPGDSSIIAGAQGVLASNNDLNDYTYAHSNLGRIEPQKVKAQLAKDLRESGMKKTESVVKTMIANGNIAYGSGGFGYGGVGKFIGAGNVDTRSDIDYSNWRTFEELDLVEEKGGPLANPNHNKEYKPGWYFTTEQEQADIGAGKFSNVEPQQRQKMAHPDSFYVSHFDPATKSVVVDDIHLGGLETLKKLNDGDIKNVGRARDSLERHSQTWELYNSNPSIKSKIDGLGGYYTDTAKKFLKSAWETQHGGKTSPWP